MSEQDDDEVKVHQDYATVADLFYTARNTDDPADRERLLMAAREALRRAGGDHSVLLRDVADGSDHWPIHGR